MPVVAPAVDPAGCDVIIWEDKGRIYFAEVITGDVFESFIDPISLTLELPHSYLIGIVMPDGSLGKIYPEVLQ